MNTDVARPLGQQTGSAEATMLRTLNTFAVDLIQIPSTEDLFWYVAQNVVGRLNFVDCVIYQADAAGTSLRQVAAWGAKNPFGRSILNPLVIPFGQGVTGQVAQSRQPVIVDDLLNDRNYIPDTEPARSEICVPLILKGRVVGVIDSEHPDPRAFGTAELEILTTVAAMTAAKLELLAESQRSEQRYHDLVASHEQLTQETIARKALEARLSEARRLEAIGVLAGRFAHEFNNLLTVVLGNLELLDATLSTPETAPFLGEARSAADRGARLVRDMLAFAQRARLEPSDQDLNTVVPLVLSQQFPGMKDRLILNLAPDLWRVSLDRKALDTIVQKLVENAFDASGEQGQVLIGTENILHHNTDNLQRAESMPPGRYVRVSVADCGVGIPARRLAQVFDPFFSTKPLGQGSGLGLSIVRGLTQQSGGFVDVASQPGEGSTFSLYFPALG